VLYTRDGSRVLGRHPTYQKALAQERAIEANKHRRRNPSSDPYAGGAVTDILLFEENSQPLVREYNDLTRQMERRVMKGEYDRNLALRSWKRFVDHVSRAYYREMGGQSESSAGRAAPGHAFTAKERLNAAHLYMQHNEERNRRVLGRWYS
jgi:hypothetical protein